MLDNRRSVVFLIMDHRKYKYLCYYRGVCKISLSNLSVTLQVYCMLYVVAIYLICSLQVVANGTK
jgi:hypothetical protein